jgi:hypothetical protein
MGDQIRRDSLAHTVLLCWEILERLLQLPWGVQGAPFEGKPGPAPGGKRPVGRKRPRKAGHERPYRGILIGQRDPAKWIEELKLRRVLRGDFLCLAQAPFRGESLVVLHNGRWRSSPP